MRNRALLDRALLERIRPGAALILVSRAHLVDFDALTEFSTRRPLPRRHRRLPAGAARPGASHPPRAQCRPLRPPGPGTVQGGRCGKSAKMVLDDLEAIANGMPPQRMQRAEPELAPRYASTRVKGHGAG